MPNVREFTKGAAMLAALAGVACGGQAPDGTGDAEAAAVTAVEAPASSDASLRLATGIEMHYTEHGAATGETVLFLHGYTDTRRSWEKVIDRLLDTSPELRLIAVDLRGHGRTSMPDPATCAANPGECFEPRDFAADVIAFLDAMGIEGAHLAGHSLGTVVAQEVALAAPDRVRSITLVATTATLAGNPLLQEFLIDGLIMGPWKEALVQKGHVWPNDVYSLTPLDVDSSMHDWLAVNWVTERSADPDYLARIASETSRMRIGSWIGVIQSLRNMDNASRLESIAAPVLVLWPVQDVFFDANSQAVLRTALDAAVAACTSAYVWKQYGVAPTPTDGTQTDLGHNLQWGAPDAVADDIASFVRDGTVPATITWADPADPRRLHSGPATAGTLITSPDCRPR